jgi:hypothetical protein
MIVTWVNSSRDISDNRTETKNELINGVPLVDRITPAQVSMTGVNSRAIDRRSSRDESETPVATDSVRQATDVSGWINSPCTIREAEHEQPKSRQSPSTEAVCRQGASRSNRSRSGACGAMRDRPSPSRHPTSRAEISPHRNRCVSSPAPRSSPEVSVLLPLTVPDSESHRSATPATPNGWSLAAGG